MASKHTVEGTEDNFKLEILQSPVPVLVDFWAPWCGPCRMIAPVLEEFAERFEGKVKVVKVNVDDEAMLGALYQIRSIPTLMAFHQGQILGRMAGFGGKAQLQRVFEEMASLNEQPQAQV